MIAALDRLLRGLLALLLGVLTASVFLQVLARFVLRYPLPWTEEITRLAFVYAIFVGALLAVRDRTHISVDVVVDALPPPVARAVSATGTVLVGAFLVVVIWQGSALVAATGIQMTPVLQIPFRYLYAVIPASGALMLLYLVLGALERRRGAVGSP